MAKYLTYEEFIELAKKNYEKGGDGYVECLSKKDWEQSQDIYGKLTTSKAIEMFKIADDINRDMQGYADHFDTIETEEKSNTLHHGYRCNKCNKAFINYKVIEENNGFNGWDGPTHWESYAVSPCCCYDFEEVDDITDDEYQSAEEDAFDYRERQEMEDMLSYYGML